MPKGCTLEIEHIESGSALVCGKRTCIKPAWIAITDRWPTGPSNAPVRILILCKRCASRVFGLLAAEVLDDAR
jgi:hypothetical protein